VKQLTVDSNVTRHLMKRTKLDFNDCSLAAGVQAVNVITWVAAWRGTHVSDVDAKITRPHSQSLVL